MGSGRRDPMLPQSPAKPPAPVRPAVPPSPELVGAQLSPRHSAHGHLSSHAQCSLLNPQNSLPVAPRSHRGAPLAPDPTAQPFQMARGGTSARPQPWTLARADAPSTCGSLSSGVLGPRHAPVLCQVTDSDPPVILLWSDLFCVLTTSPFLTSHHSLCPPSLPLPTERMVLTPPSLGSPSHLGLRGHLAHGPSCPWIVALVTPNSVESVHPVLLRCPSRTDLLPARLSEPRAPRLHRSPPGAHWPLAELAPAWPWITCGFIDPSLRPQTSHQAWRVWRRGDRQDEASALFTPPSCALNDAKGTSDGVSLSRADSPEEGAGGPAVWMDAGPLGCCSPRPRLTVPAEWRRGTGQPVKGGAGHTAARARWPGAFSAFFF